MVTSCAEINSALLIILIIHDYLRINGQCYCQCFVNKMYCNFWSLVVGRPTISGFWGCCQQQSRHSVCFIRSPDTNNLFVSSFNHGNNFEIFWLWLFNKDKKGRPWFTIQDLKISKGLSHVPVLQIDFGALLKKTICFPSIHTVYCIDIIASAIWSCLCR